jgi:hypothetical protein
MSLSYHEWSAQWAKERQYRGARISEEGPSSRIQRVINLWNGEMPSDWERRDWSFLKKRGFRRGDENDPQPEHRLEKTLFDHPKWDVKGEKVSMRLYAELNEISFGNLGNGQRKIDVLALLEIEGRSIPLAIEMKGRSTNNCWFAVVQNLQQLGLLRSYPQALLATNALLKPFELLPLSNSWGMVLGPQEFFNTRGQKQNSFHQTQELVHAIRRKLGIVILLAAFSKKIRGSIDLLTDVQTFSR